MNKTIDIVVGLQYGDEGKAKIVSDLCRKNYYQYCVRFNGGPNAGHRFYKTKSISLVAHQIPIGLYFGISSYIGPSCVVDLNKLEKEFEAALKYLINGTTILYIAENAHVICKEHIDEDSRDVKIGTTRSGIGPCYSSKMLRIGKQIKDVEHNIFKHKNVVKIDPFYMASQLNNFNTIFEGAQGFGLDIDWGNYPYVTSSNTIISSVFTVGADYKKIRNVYGVAKAYETYSTFLDFQPNEPVLEKIQELGHEFGETTGRKRKCNWLNLDNLKRAIYINHIDKLIINKIDILKNVGVYKVIHSNKINDFDTLDDFKNFINTEIGKMHNPPEIIYSDNPYSI